MVLKVAAFSRSIYPVSEEKHRLPMRKRVQASVAGLYPFSFLLLEFSVYDIVSYNF